MIDYGLTTSANTDPGAYKIHPTQPVTFTRANPRTTMADDVGGNLRVGSANVENFFTTLDDGNNKCPPSNTADDCRGANNAPSSRRQRTKVVEELVGMNADAVALMELQNNGSVAIQNLVDALNARLGAPLYARVPFAATGGGTDAIQVGMIYKPSRLSLVGAALSDTAAINNRAPMAQTFAAPNGEKFNLVANHLKSKGCSDFTAGPGDADSGDLQGCFNARRVQQVDELRGFVAHGAGPERRERHAAGGRLQRLRQGRPDRRPDQQRLRRPDRPLPGQAGREATATRTCSTAARAASTRRSANNTLSSKVTGVTEWHINADEPLVIDYNQEFKQPACPACGPDYYTPSPYRASDHDPIVRGPEPGARDQRHGRQRLARRHARATTSSPAAPAPTGSPATAAATCSSTPRSATPATPSPTSRPTTTAWSWRALLASIGATPPTADVERRRALVASGSNTVVMVDTDGSAGPVAPRLLVTLLDVSPANIDPLRDMGLGTPTAVTAAVKASAKAATLRTMTAAQSRAVSPLNESKTPSLPRCRPSPWRSPPDPPTRRSATAASTASAGWSTAGDAAAVGGHLVLTTCVGGRPGRRRRRPGPGAPQRLGQRPARRPAAAPAASRTFAGHRRRRARSTRPTSSTAYEGSAASQTFTAAAGSQLSFQFDLGTLDQRDPTDGRLRLRGHRRPGGHAGRRVRPRRPVAGGGYRRRRPAGRTSHHAGAGGSHTISFGVVDVGDFNDTSALSDAATCGVSAVPGVAWH